jgi:acyl-CoA synthetase (AMP-forming)/AMP-acid ligase II
MVLQRNHVERAPDYRHRVEFNLADVFEAVADLLGDREALVCGQRRLSFADVDERATRLAHFLASAGIGSGDHVGVHLHNCTEYLETMLAAFKLRAVPVNVNYRYVADELRYLLADADCRAVVHEADFAPMLADLLPDLPHLSTTLARGDDYEAALAAASPDRDFPPRSGDDRYILYTGGTTGMPKGVVWRHEDIFFGAMGGGNFGGPGVTTKDELLTNAAKGISRCLPACPFMHGTAHWMAFATLFGGGAVIIFPERRLDPRRLLELIAAERVNFLVIVGDAFARPLVDELEGDAELTASVRSLSLMLSGGAILSPALKDALHRLLPSTLIVDGYGASETGGQGQMVAGRPATDAHPRFAVNDQTTVLDDDWRPVEPGSGAIGRVARRGYIPLGYYKDPEKTAATFPVIDGVRWAVPGDFATVETDGTIVLFGRGSVSINSGGEKVFPEEVEAVLKGHPQVLDAVVVGVPDTRWGERVAAVVQARPGSTPSAAELAEHCRAALAGYKVPRDVVLVDSIVRSPSGKPDYRWAKNEATKALTR